MRLAGVTAWGGAGKTALVTHWVQDAGGAARRPGIRGVFGWSFYADPSAEHWADGLLGWAERTLGVPVPAAQPAAAVLALLRAVPLVLVLDGLEVVQEGPAGDGYGQFLDGTLREVLAGACQQRHGSLILLTSRFSFADLETFDGGSARMLDVPPFTPAEGAALLAAAGGDWLPDGERQMLVAAVDGHALAVGTLAGLLADRPPSGDLTALREDLAAAARTSDRVRRVLRFYADRLSEPDRYLLAALSMFGRPTGPEAVLTVGAASGVRRPPGRVDADDGGNRGAGTARRPGFLAPGRHGVRAPPGPGRVPVAGHGRGRGRRRDHPDRNPGGPRDQPGRRARGGRGHRTAAGRRRVAGRQRPVQQPH